MPAMLRSLASVAIAAFSCGALLAQPVPPKKSSPAAQAAPTAATASDDEERALEIAI